MKMINLSVRAKNWLKIFHLFSVAAWLGGQMCLISLQMAKAQLALPEHQYAILMAINEIDTIIIVSGAMGCLITGLIFSAMTPWGFFKHRWITVKWIFTVLLILFGTFFLGPWMNDLASLSKLEFANVVLNEKYLYIENLSTIFGNLQFAILIFLTVVSVLKPWKKKAVAKSSFSLK